MAEVYIYPPYQAGPSRQGDTCAALIAVVPPVGAELVKEAVKIHGIGLDDDNVIALGDVSVNVGSPDWSDIHMPSSRPEPKPEKTGSMFLLKQRQNGEAKNGQVFYKAAGSIAAVASVFDADPNPGGVDRLPANGKVNRAMHMLLGNTARLLTTEDK